MTIKQQTVPFQGIPDQGCMQYSNQRVPLNEPFRDMQLPVMKGNELPEDEKKIIIQLGSSALQRSTFQYYSIILGNRPDWQQFCVNRSKKNG